MLALTQSRAPAEEAARATPANATRSNPRARQKPRGDASKERARDVRARIRVVDRPITPSTSPRLQHHRLTFHAMATPGTHPDDACAPDARCARARAPEEPAATNHRGHSRASVPDSGPRAGFRALARRVGRHNLLDSRAIIIRLLKRVNRSGRVENTGTMPRGRRCSPPSRRARALARARNALVPAHRARLARPRRARASRRRRIPPRRPRSSFVEPFFPACARFQRLRSQRRVARIPLWGDVFSTGTHFRRGSHLPPFSPSSVFRMRLQKRLPRVAGDST